jgi:hypothetical protein
MVRSLLRLMDGEGACIVGSTVQGLVCFSGANERWPAGTLKPKDLNILVNEVKLAEVIQLLRDQFGLTV